MERGPRHLATTADDLPPETEELLSLMAHELHEPLRKIATFADLLQQRAGPTLDSESAEYLERMQRATARIRATLTCVLAFSRLGRGLSFAQIDLDEVVAGAVEKAQGPIEAAGARVEIGQLPSIQGDPFQMQELFEQLLDNALKFRRDGVAPVIQIRAAPGAVAGEHLIQVEDNGIGFDDTYAERIFRPFERLHGRGKYLGAGMGLSICRKIAARHGGRLDAHGALGQGAVFTLTLRGAAPPPSATDP